MSEIYELLFSSEDNFEGSVGDNKRISIQDKNKNYLNAIIVSEKGTGAINLFKSFEKIEKNCVRLTCYDLECSIKNKKIKEYLIENKYSFVNYCAEKSNENILIVQIIRDPIEQKISEFFHNIKSYMNDNSYKNIVDVFNEKIPNLPGLSEISIVPEKNIYQIPFNKEEKYGLYIDGKITYLILRYDNISNWNSIIRQIKGFENFIMIKEDYEWNSENDEIYEKFARNYLINEDYLESIYDFYEPILFHYFKKDEIYSMRQRWPTK